MNHYKPLLIIIYQAFITHHKPLLSTIINHYAPLLTIIYHYLANDCLFFSLKRPKNHSGTPRRAEISEI